MKEIKYYDKINKKMIVLTVKNDVADFMKKSKREENRDNKKWNKNTVSLDAIIEKWNKSGYCDIENYLEEDEYDLEELNVSYFEFQKKRLPELFSKLPDRNRKVLELKLKKNYSNVKIAKTLEITEGMVRYLIKKGYEKLKKMI